MCDIKIKCDHMGKRDIVKHCNGKRHQDLAKSMQSQHRLNFSVPSTSELLQRTEAELKMAVLTASANVPMAFHDCLSPTIRSVFPDSKIASKYHSASTKATCMLNIAVAPSLIKDLVESMQSHPFSLSIDGSNDTGLEKMNPITIRLYDINNKKIVTRFLDMCSSTSASAEGVYGVVEEKLMDLLQCSNPWNFCTSVGVDNTSVNIGVRNSLKTRITRRNPSVFFNGCPCHIIHNAAQYAAEAFNSVCGFDVEEFVVDIFYWFDKSTKRKNELRSYCMFCDQEYRAIIKHVSTRWLSLEIAVNRSLMQYPSLMSYFKSEDEPQQRFQRLNEVFNDPLTEVYLLFYQAVLPVFTHANKFLQREEPLIHVLQAWLERLIKNVLSKFVKPSVISEALNDGGKLSSVDFVDPENHVNNSKLVIGFMTKQKLDQLFNDGDITCRQRDAFFNAIKCFLIRATEYLLKWCPLEDELLTHAKWLCFEDRLESSFNSVEYFVHRYSEIFSGMDKERLNEQFLSYQLLRDEDIPEAVKEITSDDLYRVDALWGFLRDVKAPGTNRSEYDLLFKVAEAVMTIPHSNAGEERIFSLINKNKTPSRSSLKLDGTLSSLIVVKTHIEDAIQWKPSETLIHMAKKATKTYNSKHL